MRRGAPGRAMRRPLEASARPQPALRPARAPANRAHRAAPARSALLTPEDMPAKLCLAALPTFRSREEDLAGVKGGHGKGKKGPGKKGPGEKGGKKK